MRAFSNPTEPFLTEWLPRVPNPSPLPGVMYMSSSYLDRFAQTVTNEPVIPVPPPFTSHQDLSDPPVFGYTKEQEADFAARGSFPWEIDEFQDTWPAAAKANQTPLAPKV